jgi:molybdenum cofactor biosynthesis enzyme
MLVENVKKAVANGQIFNVKFTKVNGEIRIMNARIGVKKDLKGVGMGYNAISKNILTVYDMQKKGYRSIKCERIISIKIDKVRYCVD